MLKLPRHLSIIMDGNGRWATKRALPRISGHEAGAEVAKNIIRATADAGIQTLSMFAFSCENWQRPKDEVGFLMSLLLKGLQRETKKLHQNNIKLTVIGDISQLNNGLQEQIKQAESQTANNTGLHLVLALNYSGRWDLAQATQRIAQKVQAETLRPENITEAMIAEHLSTYPISEPDLLIRTSGEKRLSNYLLWQFAYTEFYFTDTQWPDFGLEELHRAFADYAQRQRRFGKTADQVQVQTEGAT